MRGAGGYLQGYFWKHKGQDCHRQGFGGSGLSRLLSQGADSRFPEAGSAGQGSEEVELFKVKVVARGPGVIPVLEVKKKTSGGGLTKWEVFKLQMQAGGTNKAVEPEKERREV